MAGTVKDMSLIKQVLQLKQLGESNRGIAKKLPINKETVNSYMSKVESNKWKIDELLQVDNLELERMFHAGSPAYTDVRIQDFLSMLPYIKEQLSDPKNHVTRQVLYDEYNRSSPMAMDSPSSITISSKILWPRKMCSGSLVKHLQTRRKAHGGLCGRQTGVCQC